MNDGPRISPWWLAPPAALIALNLIAINTTSPSDMRNGVYQGSVVASALVSAMLFGGYSVMAAWFARANVREALALRRPRDLRQAALMSAGCVVVVSAVSLALDPFLHGDRDQGLTPTRSPHGDEWLVLALALVVLGLLVPLGEELLFRGLTFATLGRYAVPGSAVFFALAHGLPQLLIQVLIAGLLLGELRRRTDSLWPGVATHATINLLGILLALATVSH
jgi:membrane protease YdiL (CAAX protease family)